MGKAVDHTCAYREQDGWGGWMGDQVEQKSREASHTHEGASNIGKKFNPINANPTNPTIVPQTYNRV
jgi:hypothetical protein